MRSQGVNVPRRVVFVGLLWIVPWFRRAASHWHGGEFVTRDMVREMINVFVSTAAGLIAAWYLRSRLVRSQLLHDATERRDRHAWALTIGAIVGSVVGGVALVFPFVGDGLGLGHGPSGPNRFDVAGILPDLVVVHAFWGVLGCAAAIATTSLAGRLVPPSRE